MCGRYALTTPPEVLAEMLKLHWLRYEYKLRYNVAPTQTVPVMRVGEGGERELVGMHWGLIPSWAKERAIGNRLINARGESADEKPAFRHAFKKRRCVIPASGFYEWKKLDAKRKQPYLITRADGMPLLVAGLWESWSDPSSGGGESLESCTILTTEANETLAELHDRMPVVLDAQGCERWLSGSEGDVKDVESLKRLLRPAPGKWFVSHPVSTRVNSPKHDDASVMERVQESEEETQAPAGARKKKSGGRKSRGVGEAGLFE